MKTTPETTTTMFTTRRGLRAAAAALLGVTALALLAPLAMNGGSADAAIRTTSVSGFVYITTPCSLGAQPIINLGVGDRIEGNIEVEIGSAGQSAVAWAYGVGGVSTNGPKTPYRFTSNVNAEFMACVGAPGMRASVSYTVARAPLWQQVAVKTSGLKLAQ